MKTDIHPDYQDATITCSCGNTFQTRSTGGDFRVELCNECHPFYTGRQKLVDSGGRIDRFNKRYGDGVKSKKAKAKATEAPAEEAASEEA